jgi:hypothetical protein
LIKHLLPPDSGPTIEKKNSSTFDCPGSVIIRPNPSKVNVLRGRESISISVITGCYVRAKMRKRGQATFSVVLSMSRDFLFLREKVACPLFLRVCLSGASHAEAEKSERRKALKI